MRDRMHAVQGRLVVQSEPDRGSTITASAPILHQEQN